MGCFYCWKNEEGQCALKDDMTSIFKKYISADIVIWSFPNYFYGMPSSAKRIMDRLLPLYYQNLATDDNCTTYHLRRHKLEEQKYILFCSCGLYNTIENIDGIKKQFELLYGNKCDMLFCSESQLLSNSFMDYCTFAGTSTGVTKAFTPSMRSTFTSVPAGIGAPEVLRAVHSMAPSFT